MLFLGISFFGDANACPSTPTVCDEITEVRLSSGTYDGLYLSKVCESTITDAIPETFDFDTVMNASFDGNTIAGNTNFTIETIDRLLLKRRIPDTTDWITLMDQQVKTIDDMNILYEDRTAGSQRTYNYAVVPMLGGIESNYSYQTLTTSFNGLFIVHKKSIYNTPMTDSCTFDRNYNVPSAFVELMNKKYPIKVRNTDAKYHTGKVSGVFIPVDADGCTFNQDTVLVKNFEDEIEEVLASDGELLIKIYDGRSWLVSIGSVISNNGEQGCDKRTISFEWTETGDCDSEQDLYNAGIIDTEKAYWSKSYND